MRILRPLLVAPRTIAYREQDIELTPDTVLVRHVCTAPSQGTGIHRYRHTFLTGTARVGGIRVSQALADHSDKQTTMRYVHSSTEEMRNAANNTDYAEAFVNEMRASS